MICALSFRYKLPVYGSSHWLLFLHYRNPYLILRIFRIGADVYLNVGSAAVFISGCGQPLCHDAPFRSSNHRLVPVPGKTAHVDAGTRYSSNGASAGRVPETAIKYLQSSSLFQMLTPSRPAGWPSIIDASFCIVPSAAAFPHICGTTAKNFSSDFYS